VSNRMTTVLMFLLGITLTLAIVLAVIVFTGDDDTSGTAATTSSSDATTTTTAGTTAATTTVATTTTTAAVTTTAPACAGLSGATIPAPGPGVTFQNGDFDADGAMDQFIGYQAGDGSGRVQIALSYGYATEMTTFMPGIALAAQQFAPGDAWLGLARIDSGASTDVVAWFQLNGCSIGYSTADGGEVRFILGGGAMHMDGMVCNLDGFTTRSAQTGDTINWDYRTIQYVWDPVGRTFVNMGIADSTLTSPADDGVIFTASEFSCPFGP